MENAVSLTKYLHQVKPREESYVNHVDRIQGLFTISEGQAGLDYETTVFGVMMDYQKTRPGFFGLGQGDMPGDTPVQTAGYDGGVDIEAAEPYNAEQQYSI